LNTIIIPYRVIKKRSSLSLTENRTLPGLDAIRAIAILMVFFFHAGALACGYLGVHLFFVLSGFLITGLLIRTKEQNFGSFLTGFYGRRVLRIFPVYYLYLLIMFLLTLIPLSVAGKPAAELQILKHQLPYAVSYLYDFYHASSAFVTSRFLTHFWSLAVEEQFYLIWPFLIFIIPNKHLKTFFITLIILGPFIRFAESIMHSMPALSGYFVKEQNLFINVLPFSNIDAFACGALFTLRPAKTKPGTILALFVTVVGLGVLTEYLITGHIVATAFGYRPSMGDSGKSIWGYTAINILSGIVISAVSQKQFFPGIFANKALNYIGKISYGLYIFHYPIILLFLSRGFINGMPLIARIFVALLLSIAVSGLSYSLFEKKFLNLKEKFFPSPR
jgi:peptidoglycan/LPS O-acetylase OafA/YrhL